MSHTATSLKRLLEGNRLIKVGGAHDGLSAKLVQRNGFDAVWASGFEISAKYGVPDASILTMTQLLEAARNMADTVHIPVVADCDSGFGDAVNVHYMVRAYEAARISAVCIEDKMFPKANSFLAGRYQLLSPVEEFVKKIEVAVATRTSAEFIIIARVEALIAGLSQTDALERAQAYVDAGADAILIHSKRKTAEQVFEFARAWGSRAPLVIVPTTYPEVTAQEIERAGIRMVIYANYSLRSSLTAMDSALKHIQSTGTCAHIEQDIASLDEVFELTNARTLEEIGR